MHPNGQSFQHLSYGYARISIIHDKYQGSLLCLARTCPDCFFFILFIFFLNTDFHLYNPPAISLIFFKQKTAVPRTHFFHAQDTAVFFCYIKIFKEEITSSVQDYASPQSLVNSFVVFMLIQSFGFCNMGKAAKLQIEKRFMRLRAVPNVLRPCAVQVLFLQVREAAECVSV